MGKTPRRNRDIVVKTQFNIGGSRGKSVRGFIADYVARGAATDPSLGYLPPTDRPVEEGDGVAFTLNRTAISKQETLALADHVEELFQQGDRAIQQMVFSFDPQYLADQGLVPSDLSVLEKGGYKYNYDDIRLRHCVQAGVSTLLENEGYYDGEMVAAIQSDTFHLHVHAVVYEDGSKYTRKHGKEERGVLKESSLNRLSHAMDRYLENTKDLSCVPTQRILLPESVPKPAETAVDASPVQTAYVDKYLMLLEAKEREKALEKLVPDERVEQMLSEIGEEDVRGV